MSPPIFRNYLKNGDAQRQQIWVNCAKIKNTPFLSTLTSRGAGFKLKDRAVGTVLVRMFSNFQVRNWSGYIQKVYLGFVILVTSGQVKFRPGPLPITLGEKLLFRP